MRRCLSGKLDLAWTQILRFRSAPTRSYLASFSLFFFILNVPEPISRIFYGKETHKMCARGKKRRRRSRKQKKKTPIGINTSDLNRLHKAAKTTERALNPSSDSLFRGVIQEMLEDVHSGRGSEPPRRCWRSGKADLLISASKTRPPPPQKKPFWVRRKKGNWV